MQIFINIEDASGNKYGDGPITTATEWQSVRRLDAAGTFAFTMPASDSQSALLAQKLIAVCWSVESTGVVEHGAGIIESIAVQPNPNGATMLRVSGSDLLRELVYRRVGELDLFQETPFGVTHLAESFASGDPTTPVTLPASILLESSDNGPYNFLNIGYTTQFNRLDFTITTANTVATSVTWQYNSTTGQKQLSGLVDTTVVDGVPFAQSGSISFDIPTDWAVGDNGYVIRVYSSPEDLTAFALTAVNMVVIEPVADGLQQIMALAPPGWSLDAAGEFETELPVYMQFNGESVLAALVRLAEQTGEHFRLSASGRRVEWLRPPLQSSGLRAIAASETGADTMLILSLSREDETTEMFNRLYVYGGGADGNARLTLADCIRTPAAGYTLNTSESYIEHTTMQAAYGRIDAQETFPDIVASDSSPGAREAAANALYDRAFVMLERGSALHSSYSITVIPSQYKIYPGQSLKVIYHEWVDGFHSVDIDTDLTVLEVAQSIGQDGIMTSGLTVATVESWPVNDYRAVARAMGEMQTRPAVKEPTTGLTSTGSGTPVGIGVENGLVTSVNRIEAIEDGVWPPTPENQSIKSIWTKNGLVVKVEYIEFS